MNLHHLGLSLLLLFRISNLEVCLSFFICILYTFWLCYICFILFFIFQALNFASLFFYVLHILCHLVAFSSCCISPRSFLLQSSNLNWEFTFFKFLRSLSPFLIQNSHYLISKNQMSITVSLTNRLILHKFSASLNIVLTVVLISQKVILELNHNSIYEYIFPRQRFTWYW